MRRFLNQRFSRKEGSRGRPVPCPARSPDLTPLVFFVWGQMCNLVYTLPFVSEEDVVALIVVVAAGAINHTPGVFVIVRT